MFDLSAGGARRIKQIRFAALGLGALVALSFVLALVLIDGKTVRSAIGARLEATLNQPVELGDVDLSIFPLPAARIRDVRIGAAPRPLLEAREMRVGVSLPALLVGRVVLRSLQLASPQLHLASGASQAAPGKLTSRWDAERAEDVELAITSLAVHEGKLDLGSQRLEEIELSGGLDLTLGASFDFSARAPGLAGIEEGHLEIQSLSGAPAEWSWTANARVAQLNLEDLRERVGFRGLWGKASGKLDASGTGASPQHASLELESQDLEIRGSALRLWGPTRLLAQYPERTLDADLTQARVSVAQLLEKPPGVALRASARDIENEPLLLRVGELRIESDALRAGGDLELRSGAPVLDLESGSLDLAALASAWTRPDWLPRSGRFELEHLRLDGASLALRVDGSLERVQATLPGGLEVELEGPVFADGATLGAKALSVELAGEMLSTSLSYDWMSKQLEIGLVSEGARIQPLLEKLGNFKDVTGRLYARLELAGPLDWFSLKGKGEFDLVDGEWKGLSLMKLAEREPTEERIREGDPPQRIRGRFEVDEDEVHLIEGTIEQEFGLAKLTGLLYLRDLTVDLNGELSVFRPDLAEPVVLPILKVGGTLNAMSASIGNGETQEVREAEANMVEAFRKAEREMRIKERQKRKQGGSSGG